VATLTSLVDRVRLELGDTGRSFVWTATATGTNRYEMPYSPVLGSTLAVFNAGVNVSLAVVVEEHTGVLTFDTAPTLGNALSAQGTHYRFFTTVELTAIVEAAVNEHLHNRTDAFGRAMNVTNLPVVEEYPVALLGTVQALYTLATDASFDIDISTPDGISIPRAERFRQLMEMINARKVQYDDLCKALNIGLTRIETFTFRRISKTTNRYVPVYMPQEVDDRSAPQRIFLPIPTYGGSPVPSDAAPFDLVFTQGDDYSFDIDFPFDITGHTMLAQVRLYPESAAVVAEIAVQVTNVALGKATLSLTSAQTTKFPLRTFWDLQVTDPNGLQYTYVNGAVFAKRQISHTP
jgi:hypothetical protein